MNKKILVVEDEKDILEYLASYIPLLGYELETAEDGLQALAKVNAFQPGLVLLDLLLPKMDGTQVLKEIRKHHPQIKIMILTGTRRDAAELMQMGADEVLYKPLDLTALSEHIKTLLPAEPETKSETAEIARMMIVEDEEDIRDYLRREVFLPLGLEVYEAPDGETALRIFKEKQPHIVIVDLAIPNKIHGYTLIQQLATSVDPPAPKSIIVATAALGDTVEDLKRQGYPVFRKPLDLERLKERVFEACRRNQLRLKKN